LKQATTILALLGAIVLAGCGNGDTTSQSTFNNGSGDQPFKPTTHLSHRSLVTNNFAGQLQVMDTVQDRLTTYTFAVGAQPTYMQSSPDGTLTLVNNTGANTLSSFNNNLEAVKGTVNLGGFTDSFVSSVSNQFGFAAVYNYSNGNAPSLPGAILPFNPTDGSLNLAIPFPNVRYIALDVAEKHMLAFKDVIDSDGNWNAYWVDLTKNDVTGLPLVSKLTLPANTLSSPVAAFFSSDSNTAYILNCGIECGATGAPSVTILNVSNDASAPSVFVQQIPVSGARRGLIDLTAKKLYVTGSTTTTLTDAGNNVVQDGYFTTIDLAAQTASAPIRIGNGAKRWIRNINGVFWVASLNCGVQSCITMVNPANGTATVLPTAKGDATGIALSVNSGEVYTIEGGELFIYDQQANPITSQYNTDVKGLASDVLYIN
jgi:hypothetical protein